MSALTERGTLPIGLEHDGKVHCEFELREQLVSDAIEVQENPKLDQARIEKSNSYFNMCILAHRLISLGSIPKEEITPELIMSMLQKDFNEFALADNRMEQRRISFREKKPAQQDKGAGAQKAGVQG